MHTPSKKSSNPYMSLLRTAWQHAKEDRPRFVVTYLMFMVSSLIESLNPIIWGLFINELQKEGVDALRSGWIYVGIYLLIWLVDWLFHGFARVSEQKLAFNMSKRYLEDLYHKALHLPVKWHQDQHSGVIISRIRKAYEALKEFFKAGFRYLHVIAKFVLSFGAMIYFSPLFGTIAVVIGMLAVFIIFQFDKPYIAASREVNEKEHIVSSTLFDSLSNIITVITLRLEKRMEKGLFNRITDVFPPYKRKVIVNEWKWFVVDFLVAVMYATILMGYMYQNWKPGEVFLIGGLVTLIGYVQRFTSIFHDIAWLYTQVVHYNTDIETAQNIVDAYAENHLPEDQDLLPANWKQIELKNLNFVHNKADERNGQLLGLHQLNIQLQKGKKIALIGESGSGKSTLLALLRGLYPSLPGLELSVDGQPFDDLGIISNHVTLFPQEPEIFENTIQYNITLGLPCEAEELKRICEVAHFTEVIAQLPKGLESSIKEKGVNLSGGQKQRLALARGIMAAKDSHILLLDEPTSSVDPKTEVHIYDQLFTAFAEKAVVSSLHRLHLLTKFDYVYILDKGRVVDQGTFEHLRANSVIFQELWRHQEEAQAVGGVEG
ncbi:MAG: ABC transporter ATP-binding protein [Bacteroidota bacterium]